MIGSEMTDQGDLRKKIRPKNIHAEIFYRIQTWNSHPFALSRAFVGLAKIIRQAEHEISKSFLYVTFVGNLGDGLT